MLNLPLRYPGGKTQLVNYIESFIRANDLVGCTIYEPYAGGAAVSLNMLDRDLVTRAIINEKDPLIYCFWKSVFEHTEELCELIDRTVINLTNWREMAKYRDPAFCVNKSIVRIGFACLFLNRTSFSGLLISNPLGGWKQISEYKIDCRFNKDKLIKHIHSISRFKQQVCVINGDALDFMKMRIKYKPNRKFFVYIDPPYYLQGKNLYRFYYTIDQHQDLSKYLLSKTFPWLLSYDQHDFIKHLYEQKHETSDKLYFQNTYFDYSVRFSKSRQAELLISNRELPPPLQLVVKKISNS